MCGINSRDFKVASLFAQFCYSLRGLVQRTNRHNKVERTHSVKGEFASELAPVKFRTTHTLG